MGKIRSEIEKIKQIKEEQVKLTNANKLWQRRELYCRLYKKCKVKKNVVMYEAYAGRGLICNPYALFRQFMERKDFGRYIHVWSLDNLEDNQRTIEEYSQYSNVIFVEHNSDEYLKYLASAKYLVNNVTFPTYFTKKKEQIYINTWHGIPLKTLGYDLPRGVIDVSNIIRNFLCTDYIIAPNEFQTEMYKSAYKLDGIYQGQFIQEGQPRNDRTLHASREEVLKKLQQYGVQINPDKQIIMYAPTWKGASYGNPDVGLATYFNFISVLEEHIDTDKYQVLVKPHQVVYSYIKNNPQLTAQFIPATIDTNEILSVVDVLVSDYSSIYFDYLVSDRPVLFYIPDLEEYKEYRGLYFGVEELPGPYTKSLTELADWICNLDEVTSRTKAQYDKVKQWACPYDDGNVSERIWHVVLDGVREHRLVSDFDKGKKRLLIYPGYLQMNGITQSFISLTQLIDYEKFDVTVLVISSEKEGCAERACQLNPNLRVLYRNSSYNATLKEEIRKELLVRDGLKKDIRKVYYSKDFFEREYRRCFGDAQFDYVIEFTGYSIFTALLMAQAKGAKRYIWMHNDLQSNKKRTVKGEKVTAQLLDTTFTIYPMYDKLVSCSKAVMEVNRDFLEDEYTKGKFDYARNSLYYERITDSLKRNSFVTIGDTEYYIKEDIKEEDFVHKLDLIVAPKDTDINFVTMGRFFPEKNHMNLIRAFRRFHSEHENSRLYIIGEGKLREEIVKVIQKEQLQNDVILTGNLDYPFPLIHKCSCFMLPSMFEGQPMVLLEARVLGIPLVISNFSTSKDSFIENGQYVIGTTVDDIYDGMMAFYEGKVPTYEFDPVAYNKIAYQEFARLFDDKEA